MKTPEKNLVERKIQRTMMKAAKAGNKDLYTKIYDLVSKQKMKDALAICETVTPPRNNANRKYAPGYYEALKKIRLKYAKEEKKEAGK